MFKRRELVESRMRGNTHVRFGGRAGETEGRSCPHCAPARPYWVWDGTGWSPTSGARAPGGRIARGLLRLVAVELRIPLAVAALILSAIVRTALGCAVLGLLVAAIGAFFVYASTH
jgi:hypothetical protein